MRPFRSFLLLLLILGCLSGLYYVIPGNFKLPHLSDFFPELISHKTAVSISDTTKHLLQPADSSPTIPAENKSLRPADSIQKVLTFPEIIAKDFDSLSSSGRQIRIIYYGDSQIEGDRITSFLRHSLRKKYGGTGPGLLLPLMPVMETKSISLRASSNWKRYNYLSFKNGDISNKSLGPFMTICRFLPPGVSTKDEKAFVRIAPSRFADSTVRLFDNLRIFYRNSKGIVKVSVQADDKTIFSDLLKSGESMHELNCGLGRPAEIRIEFEGRVSPDICGISIENEKGVIVDNIPQRGSTGLEFTMVDSSDLKDSYRFLKPGMIIMQYGLNIVRNVRKEYGFYENGLHRQLERLKEISPGTKILVVSLTDMGFNEGDTTRSFPNISSIKNAQEEAAKVTGSGFWDSRKAMGGENSVVSWSKRNPPLVQNDLVHFTNSGADTLAALLMKDIFSYTDAARVKPAEIPAIITSINPGINYIDSLNQAKSKKSGIARSLLLRVFTYDPANSFIFTTPGFWIFLLIVLAGYSLIYRKKRLRNLYLFLISLYFYFKTGGLFLFLLIFITVVDYTCGLLIHRSERKFSRKLFIILSLVSNLGLLAYFKYSAFFAATINSLFGTHLKVFDLLSSVSNSFLGTSFDTSFIILPVGISFFTFQSLSYTLDVYRKRMEPVKNIIDFGFYVSFFPHLVAGPIVRASVFIPQLYQEFNLSKREFGHALFMISKGLIKKILISNFIAVTFVDRVFDAPSLFSGFENLMAVYGYGLQIYCDFSGYTDIAIGVALILGFRLPVNFNSPYKASSITDFWKRWHISLSQWLKDYLYISLGGNRKGKIRTYFNLMITMLLGGLWHGASLRFIIWGGLHGVGLVIDRIRSSIFGNKESFKTISKMLGIFITFNFVNFCWIFFRAGSIDNCLIMLRQICTNFSPGSYLTVIPAYGQVFLLIITGYIIHFLPEKIKESYRGLFIRTPLIGQLAFILLFAIVLWQVRTAVVMPFIYFRF